ncbi:N-carbamoylsarcosine amidase [Mycena metata]|uniref:N-carbamoylsarcosine amidase n=1 Tax=Mycena metata TaxID=1033252 RepID=A0AAD7NPI6_9AGAR|nr:N-carbamoylsarcosine amidase [Mycena metata]
MTDLITHTESASYARSGFSNKMGWGQRPALLIVDACVAYWAESSPLDLSSNPAGAASLASMKRLLDAARASSVPVIWTRVEYDQADMSDAGMFWLKSKSLNIFQRGDERGWGGWVEAAGLVPTPGSEVVIVKKYPSAFFGTDLSTRLHVLGVDTVVVCGVSTSGCVRASVLDAMQYGYRPMVVEEACGDRTPEIHNANLFDLNAKYADVVSEAEAVQRLERGW